MTTIATVTDSDHIHPTLMNSNGLTGKLSKVSPFIVLAAGLVGGYFTTQISTSVQSAKQDQAIIQLQTSQVKIIQDVEQLRADVVPRSEHIAMLKDNETLAHWIEKYNDGIQGNLQHQVDELRRSCAK